VTNVPILVLGIGNVLWADEGFGVRAVECLNQRYVLPDNVVVMDGGTQGVYLLPHVQSCSALIILDAVDYGLAPGTLKLVEDDHVPTFMGAKKISLHQAGFQEVLAAARMLGWEPKRILLVGVQPAIIEDYGGSLTPETEARIDDALAAVLAELNRLGVHAKRRTSDPEELGPVALDRRAYEQGRPDPDLAYRYGDERFLPYWRS